MTDFSMCYFSPLLSCKVSGADDAHILSRPLSTQQLDWSGVTGAFCVPLFLAPAKSSIVSCRSSEHTILLTESKSPSRKQRKRHQSHCCNTLEHTFSSHFSRLSWSQLLDGVGLVYNNKLKFYSVHLFDRYYILVRNK